MRNYRELSKIFSTNCVEDLARGNVGRVADVAQYYVENLPKFFTPADVYEVCYKDLSKNYRFEYFFKNVVANKILLGRHRLSAATLIPEFRVENNKADCVVLNGNSTCYEIKTDLDNFSRLNAQLSAYEKIFDKTYVVVAEAHRNYALKNICEDVGVIVLTSQNRLSEVRPAKFVVGSIDAKVLIRSLRKSEYYSIARKMESAPVGLTNTEVFSWCEDVFLRADAVFLRSEFCKTLKRSRGLNKGFSLSLPRSLLMASVSVNLSEADKNNLARVVNSPI
ncbi:sce7726 family protein [Pseudomonas fluorescens]|uniref:sce7726 family protein n=1 Tax=Pseudomonas fluorescens TaxID=294 RepID=UPI001782C0F8|nr:sce7726 family protein [Pseudomonas fluorescens]MBD8240300.1 sce7726 family protein [Pseudomonas fluorescens]MDY0897506.1 sce7726 family protein [Pseudomonas fluorescens]